MENIWTFGDKHYVLDLSVLGNLFHILLLLDVSGFSFPSVPSNRNETLLKIRLLCFTLKKKGILPNPQKRFRRYQKASLCVKILKESNIEIYETLMVLPVCPGEDTSATKPY